MLYRTGPDFVLLDMEILIGVHSLSQYCFIPGLATDLIERIKNAPIPLSEIPGYITFAWQRRQCSEEKQAEAISSNIEKTIKNIPGKNRIMEAAYDLNPLKGQLRRDLPDGTDLEGLLDAYRKFLALMV